MPSLVSQRACSLLLRTFLICLLALGTSSAAQDESPPAKEYSCQAVAQVPQEQRCAFVTTECEAGARIPFMELYYCTIEPAGTLAKLLFTVLLCCLLPLLFTLLGDTAELYFSPTMAIVSQSIPKMRPRFAGVTFVAMGNGAADLSANISAIRNGSVQLSAGAFTGAAMFVQCVVASEVIRIAQGAPCRGATLRDVATFTLSLLGVALSFSSGTITRWFVAGALIMYALYAAWVFGGDEWHARGRPRPNVSWSQLLEMLKQRSRSPTAPAAPWASLDEAEPLVPAPSFEQQQEQQQRPRQQQQQQAARGGGPGHHHHTANLLDAETYRQAVWADLSSDHEMAAAIRTGRHGAAGGRHAAGGGGGFQGDGASDGAPWEMEMGLSDTLSPRNAVAKGGSASAAGAYVPPQLAEPSFSALLDGAVGEQRRLLLPPPAPLLRDPSQNGEPHGHSSLSPSAERGSVMPSPFLGHKMTAGAAAEVDRQSSHASTAGTGAAFGSSFAAPSLGEGTPEETADSLWQQICNELTVGAAAEWPHLRGVRRHFRHITFPLLLPCYAALRLTIPLIDPASYSQQWLVVSMLCAPLATLAYLGVSHIWAVVAAMAIGLVLAGVVHVLTRDEEELPALDLGTSFAFGPAVFSLMGFFMGVLWIDTLASEVVGILSLVANLAALPPSLMGLTLLAWGSSLGDFFGNSALAKRGHASTALTACFAGPLFNMLVSLALGFSANFAHYGVNSIHVVLTPDVVLGCTFLATYNVVVAVVGLANGFRLPQRFFLFARAWYLLYVLIACGMGLATKLRGSQGEG